MHLSEFPASFTIDGAFCEGQAFAGPGGIVPEIAARDPQTRPSRANSFSRSSRILAFLDQKIVRIVGRHTQRAKDSEWVEG